MRLRNLKQQGQVQLRRKSGKVSPKIKIGRYQTQNSLVFLAVSYKRKLKEARHHNGLNRR